MARKKHGKDDADDLAGTVEGLARDHFEMEKAAYEARTGKTVEYVPPIPVTRTPIEETPETDAEPVTAEAETDVRTDVEGD